ncbi:hypothetical protein BpHYR1_025224 [Brachionus plicatilis]|uniref:Uncharacterized protein n=1 Tax=Brachionus plicatilis TaxID=10195 RepID=A0A3M7PFG0_BRAPC|nr:hypothetical protein BpHYR1_025224 [Brachionus plicatilis]
MVKAQNHLETDFHYLEENGTLVNGSEEQPDASHQKKSTPQSSLSTTTESTYQQEQIIEPDMSPMENRVFNRRPQFKMDDIPKLYGNDNDKIEEWIYLVETEAEDQGIDKNRLVTAVNKFLRDEFELVWMFFDAVDPSVRAELESKNVKTLDDTITQARLFSRSTWSVNNDDYIFHGLIKFYFLYWIDCQ